MEKKRATNGKFKVFLKKNIYYIIMAICLLAIAAMVTVAIVTSQNNNDLDPGIDAGPGDNVNDPDDTPPVDNPGDDDDNTPPVDNPGDGDDNTPPVDNPDEPIVVPVVLFAAPVANVNVIKDYSMDSLVWNQTLKHYAVHNGIDFGGNDGDNVMSVYDGTIIEVKYDILNGYTVKVQHNDSLVTSYSSLNEPTVAVGQTVAKGDVLGTMGVTAANEYLDGAHVHFSLYEDGKIANPYTYLTLGDK